LQSALFAMLLNDDDVADEHIVRAKSYSLNTMSDSFLRGMGVPGAITSGVKNATIEYFKQRGKGPRADYSEVAEDLLNISPALGSKYSRLDKAGDNIKYDKSGEGFKFELGNPSLEASLLTIEATVNAPLYSWYQNASNIQNGLNSDYEIWQRAHMFGGWTAWGVGAGESKKKKKKVSNQPYKPYVPKPYKVY